MRSASSGSVKVFYPPHDRTELIALLRRRTSELRGALPLKRVVLFGSWAKGRATAFSDIDVLVVYADPPRDDAYQVIWRCLRLRGLEPHVYAESEAVGLQSTLDSMARGGVDLLMPDARQ